MADNAERLRSRSSGGRFKGCVSRGYGDEGFRSDRRGRVKPFGERDKSGVSRAALTGDLLGGDGDGDGDCRVIFLLGV